MKKRRLEKWVFMLLLFILTGVGNSALAADKVILLTAHSRQEQRALDGMEKSMQEAFPDWAVRSLCIDDEGDVQGALTRLAQNGVKEVAVQPLTVMRDDLFAASQSAVREAQTAHTFTRIVLGRPLLYAAAETVERDDYLTAIFFVESEFPRLQCCNAAILLGQASGTTNEAQFKELQQRIDAAGFGNIYVCVTQGEPSVAQAVARLKEKHLQKVTLIPFAFAVSETSLLNSVSKSEVENAASLFKKAGHKTEIDTQGLGERFNIQQLFIQHTRDAITSQAAATNKQEWKAQETSVETALARWQKKEFLVVDVRTPEEFVQGHIDDALSIPISDLAERYGEISKEKAVLLVCASGRRSALANILLQQKGYMNTVSLVGGMARWNDKAENK